MKSIKTYLLPLILLCCFSIQGFSQSDIDKGNAKSIGLEQELSKTDSVLVFSYHTEQDYNELHGVDPVCTTNGKRSYCADEIYNEEPIQKIIREIDFGMLFL